MGGVFIPADFYARFLRDRIGRENVLFVSGTDCYGSPIMESYRKLHDEQGYEKRISDYVEANHESQAATLAGYDVEPDFFGGSALEPAAHVHEQMTDEIILRLKEQGVLEKRATKQFFDPVAQQFLNGRQVTQVPHPGLQVREGLCGRVRPGTSVRTGGAHRAQERAHRRDRRFAPWTTSISTFRPTSTS